MKRLIRNLAVLSALTLSARAGVRSLDIHPIVNLNTASVAQLCYLPGVGPAVAVRIVAGRPYKAVSELAKVKGFGGEGKRLAKLAPFATVTGPTTATEKLGTSNAALSLYPPAARASIVAGLRDGSVWFEPSQFGGEYIAQGGRQ